jgi:hypothetical protein
MLLLDVLTCFSADEGTIEGRVTEDNPFLLPDGRLHPLASVEFLAQAVAAHEGFRLRTEGQGVGGGFLVGIRDFVFDGALRLDDAVEVTARRTTRFEALQLVSGFVFSRGRRVAAGELKLYVTDTTTIPGDEDSGVVSAPLPPPRRSRIHPLSDGWRRSVERDAGAVSYFLDGSFPAFHGHYPSRPILPAVVSAMLAADALAELTDGSFVPARIRSAKFRRPVRPDSLVTVRRDTARDAAAGAKIFVGGEVTATVTFDPATPGSESVPRPSCG